MSLGPDVVGGETLVGVVRSETRLSAHAAIPLNSPRNRLLAEIRRWHPRPRQATLHQTSEFSFSAAENLYAP
ncbi:MAG UNVERIFIED_CONTAM: hypothetical protein LVR18_31115 [Planctomycetaceae bacterium]